MKGSREKWWKWWHSHKAVWGYGCRTLLLQTLLNFMILTTIEVNKNFCTAVSCNQENWSGNPWNSVYFLPHLWPNSYLKSRGKMGNTGKSFCFLSPIFPHLLFIEIQHLTAMIGIDCVMNLFLHISVYIANSHQGRLLFSTSDFFSHDCLRSWGTASPVSPLL